MSAAVALCGVASICKAARYQQSDCRVVAYIDHSDLGGLSARDAIRVLRDKREVRSVDLDLDLCVGDQIFLHDERITISVRYLFDHRRFIVVHKPQNERLEQPDITIVERGPPGLPKTISDLFLASTRAAFAPGAPIDVLTASKGVAESNSCYNPTGDTDQPTRFDAPIFAAEHSNVTTDHKVLFINWRGGAAPFKVALFDTRTDGIVAKAENINSTCSTRLENLHLTPGRYRIAITDANSVTAQDDQIYVIDSPPPKSPDFLTTAGLTEPARRVYAAAWLSDVDRGQWAFEAEQDVAAMACDYSPAREWTAQWGDPVSCESSDKSVATPLPKR